MGARNLEREREIEREREDTKTIPNSMAPVRVRS
jgi:hypothetical protein